MECAKRELEEETGLNARSWNRILSYYSAPGFVTEKLHLFLASDFTRGSNKLDRDEFLYTVKLPLAKAYDAIFSGEIKDGKSIIGIQYACKLFAGR